MHDKRVNNNVELMKIEYHECECMLLDHSKLTTLNFLLNDPVNPRIQEKKFLENSSSIDEEEELQEQVEHYDVENEKESFSEEEDIVSLSGTPPRDTTDPTAVLKSDK
jgi:hypothetical protein